MKNYYSLSIDEVLKDLKSSPDGLNDSQVIINQKKYGKNTLEETQKTSFLKKFFAQLSDIMVIILIISGIISIFIAIKYKNQQDLFEGILIIAICTINAFIGVIQEGKAESALEKLKSNSKSKVNVLRGGKISHINTDMLTVGDIVLLSMGDIVPADIRLIESQELMCDESVITGETQAVFKDSDAIFGADTLINMQKNMLFTKSVICGGKCKGVVTSVGKNTVIGNIATDINQEVKEQSPLQKNLNSLSQVISVIVLLICAVIYIIEVFKGKNSIIESFLTGITLAVAAVPESLPAVTSMIMALGVNRLSEEKAIVKKLPTIETLGCCQVICSDKTGTLTQNKMEVKSIFLPKDNMITLCRQKLSSDLDKLIDGMIINNGYMASGNNFVGESTEVALVNYARSLGLKFTDYKKYMVVPFSSERKMMTTLIKQKFYTSYTKGSLEKILSKSDYYLCGGVIEKLNDKKRQSFLSICDQMNNEGLRVLGFAYREYSDMPKKEETEQNLVFIGACGMYDPPRIEVYKAIQDSRNAHLKPVMITGDSPLTAYSIAKQIGICTSQSEVMTGQELDHLSDKTLDEVVTNYSVFARVVPSHKSRIVKSLQRNNKIVAMTGDGINDATSLKSANIGVGMGSGTEVAKSASDIIITDDNFSTIIKAIKEGRIIFQNIKKCLHFLFSTNIVEVLTIFITSLIYPQFDFLLPGQLLFINLVTDGFPAFSLGLEKAEKDIMNTPPRKNTKHIFDKKEIFCIGIEGMFQVFVIVILYIYCIKFFTPQIASTMCFFTFSIMQMNHSFNTKSSKSIFNKDIFNNKYLCLSYLFCMILNMVVAFTPAKDLFSLSSLTPLNWAVILVLSFSIIPFVELEKIIVNYKKSSKK